MSRGFTFCSNRRSSVEQEHVLNQGYNHRGDRQHSKCWLTGKLLEYDSRRVVNSAPIESESEMSDLRSTADLKSSSLPNESRQPSEGRIQPGTSINGYRILSVVGEGGFGIVYLANSESPLKRRVALKVIKPGMDSKQVVARFDAERQALALMDHPNVAKVFDAGMTSTIQSYFVMEYVKGVPLTEHCDRYKMSIADRLDLFIDVCEAVQHAHQKGIIHRDLKPSNILVAIDGNKAIPKVIDFGVAKAMAVPLTEKTLLTEKGQIIGTPEYMSPEQAEMSGQDIDTRTDIYALGVILYELLTGSLPFPSEYLRNKGLNHLVRIIREEDPKPPSTRVTSAKADKLNQIAASRNTGLSDLRKALKGDLDWIALKAMEKDRKRRYETAHGLATDVQRFLDNEPVVARPPSPTYRLRKLMRRNRVAFGAASLVLISLVCGLFLATWGFVRANHHFGIAQSERDVAQQERDNAERERKNAERQRDAATAARLRAEVAEKDAAAKALTLEHQMYVVRVANADKALSRDDSVWAKTELEACPEQYHTWAWRHLQHRLNATFPLSVRSVYSPSYFIADGRKLVGSSEGGSIKIWNLATRQAESVIKVGSRLHSLALSPDEKWLAAGDHNGNVTVLELGTGKQRWSAKLHEDRLDGLAFSPDGDAVATASWDTTAKVVNARSGEVIHTLGPFKHALLNVDYSPSGKYLTFSVGRFHDSVAIVVNASSGEIINKLPAGKCTIFEFGSNDEMVAIGGNQGAVTLCRFDGKDVHELKTMQGLTETVFALDFSDDGRYLAGGEVESNNSSTSAVAVWEVDSGKQVASLNTGGSNQWLDISPSGDALAIFTASKGFRVWRFLEGWGASEVSMKALVWELRFSPDSSELLASSSASGNFENAASCILDSETLAKRIEYHNAWFGKGWTDDGCVITGDGKSPGELTLVRRKTDEVVGEFVATEAFVLPVLSQDGQTMAAVGVGGGIRVWNVTTGELSSQFDIGAVQPDEFWDVCLSTDGKYAAVGPMAHGTIEVWNVTAAKQESTLYTMNGAKIWPSCFLDEGRIVVGVGENGSIAFFDVATGAVVKRFLGATGTVMVATLSPGKDILVSGGSEGKLTLWDVTSAQPLCTLWDGDQEVWSLDWSPDGRKIAAGFSDGSIRVWSAPEQENAGPEPTHPTLLGRYAPATNVVYLDPGIDEIRSKVGETMRVVFRIVATGGNTHVYLNSLQNYMHPKCFTADVVTPAVPEFSEYGIDNPWEELKGRLIECTGEVVEMEDGRLKIIVTNVDEQIRLVDEGIRSAESGRSEGVQQDVGRRTTPPNSSAPSESAKTVEANITPAIDEIRTRIGENIRIEMRVVATGGYASVYLNSELNYLDPKSFAINVEPSAVPGFAKLGIDDPRNEMPGKRVACTGKVVELADGRLTIIVTDIENQLSLVEDAR